MTNLAINIIPVDYFFHFFVQYLSFEFSLQMSFVKILDNSHVSYFYFSHRRTCNLDIFVSLLVNRKQIGMLRIILRTVILKTRPSHFSAILIVKNKNFSNNHEKMTIQDSLLATLVECYGSSILNFFEEVCASSNIPLLGVYPHALSFEKKLSHIRCRCNFYDQQAK